jgi:hypothetical protein
MDGLDSKLIKRDTIYTLLTNGFSYIRNSTGRKFSSSQEVICQEILKRWMVIFGDLAKIE